MSRGGGAPKQNVPTYRLSQLLGLCWGTADSINKIYADDKLIWSTQATSQRVDPIDSPDIFGGLQKDGGVKGLVAFLFGLSTQLLPEQLAQRLGYTRTTCPSYRGVTSLFFFEDAPTDPNGNFLNFPGFYWRANSPYLPVVTVELTHIHKSLGELHARIGNDNNPAHIVWECLTNPEFGRGTPETLLNKQSFIDAAATLHGEAFGLSLVWAEQASIQDFVSNILNHIQGVIVLDPSTGLETLKLLRGDYNEADLLTLTPDNSYIVNFQRRGWGETVNELVVAWTNPETEKTETVTYSNTANIRVQGAVVSEKRDYLGIRNSQLAWRVAARDMASASQPLATVEIEAHRDAWNLTVGDVFKLDYEEFSLDNDVFRIIEIDYGTIDEPIIRVSATEDIFALEHPNLLGGNLNEWDNPATVPTAMDHRYYMSIPYYMAIDQLGDLTVENVSPGDNYVAALGADFSRDVNSFDLTTKTVDAAGVVSYENLGERHQTTRAQLSAALPKEFVSNIPFFNWLAGDAPRVGDIMQMVPQGGLEIEELALITNIEANGSFTIRRGVLDTVPSYHSVGTNIWFIRPTSDVLDTTPRAPGEIAVYRQRTRTSLGVLASIDTPIDTYTVKRRLDLPVRVANCKIDGNDGTSPYQLPSGNAPNTYTWSNRNAATEAGELLKWTDPTVTPPVGLSLQIRYFRRDTNVEIGGGSNFVIYDGTNTPLTSKSDIFLSAVRNNGNHDGGVFVRFSTYTGNLRNYQSYQIEVLF